MVWFGESERHSEALRNGWKNRDGAWTPDDLLFLKSFFPNRKTKEIAEHLKRTVGAVKRKAKRLGLKKEKQWLRKVYREQNAGQFQKGHENWNIGLTKESDFRLKRFSDMRRGKNNPAYKTMIKNNPAKREDVRLKISKSLKGRKITTEWQNKINAKRSLILKGLIEKPTKPEATLATIIIEAELPLRYVGNGQLIIGNLCPDFVGTNGSKKVVEVFGRVFHDPYKSFRRTIPWHQQYFGRIAYYKQHGYDCLILWDDEIQNMTKEELVDRIRHFVWS